jgi:2,3-bisphosphoglycerate-independent phosphoglycerate mutase
VVEALLIVDGAAERPGPAPTSLERARTPALDVLCARGRVRAVATTPSGLEPGSETGIPTLLGHPPPEQPSRGRIEAAAAGLGVPAGQRAWRCDLYVDGVRHRPHDPTRTAAALERSSPGCRALHLRGHRFLLIAAERPEPRLAGRDIHLWGDGQRLAAALNADTVMVSGPGAAPGIARLLGARVRVPATATGTQHTDLGAKRRAALAEWGRSRRVVVHVAGPDEAAHEGDHDGKVAALEAIDAELVAPLAEAALARGGRITVSPDHGTDPHTGEHLADPVPSVCAGPGVPVEGPAWLEERLVAAEGEVAP